MCWNCRSTRLGRLTLLVIISAGGLALPANPTPAETTTSVLIIPSSHQDIAWMDSIDRCVAQRDTQVITPALACMKRDPQYHFAMEDTLGLMEYLQRHPDRKGEIAELTRQGRLEWGATYNQPYESLESGEMLVRQAYYGRKWLRKALPGCDSTAAWNPDVPGRSIQMPQILHKAGIKYLIFSRHDGGFYNWLSPDGTGVMAWSPGHYSDHLARITGDVRKVAANIAEDIRRSAAYDTTHHLPAILPRFFCTDAAAPAEFPDLFRRWHSLWKETAGSTGSAPLLRYATGAQFMDEIASAKPDIPSITGERPNVWLYIHGPTHHHAISAKREASVLLPAAETFATMDALLSGSFRQYPSKELDDAWKAAIYPDHGWGGYYGELTDETFRQKLELARDTAQKALNRATASIASRIKPSRKGIPVVVFNALSWERSGPVLFSVPADRLPPGAAESLSGMHLVDDAGTGTAFQAVHSTKQGESTLLFVAEGVPPLGYKTWYLVPGTQSSSNGNTSSASLVENQFYRIELAPGGIRQIYDKQLNTPLLSTGKFLGGELFTMQSVGNGAGEFADVQQPTMEEFDQVSRHAPEWKRIEHGPVRTAYELRLSKQEGKLRHCSVCQRLIVYHSIKRIDIETDLPDWDGTPYREFRLAFPLDSEKGQITYEVPMGTVQVGKSEIPGAAGERYKSPCKDVRPREVQNWIDCSTTTFGVTLSSSVAVCDWMDPTPKPLSSPMLQPILLASRKSCHGLGNYYLQPGDHTFRFSLTSHGGGWEDGWRAGVQANNALIAVIASPQAKTATLSESQSFCRIDPSHIQITAIKKCEDDDSVVVRCCEMLGKDTPTKIHFLLPVQSAEQTNLIEEEGKPLKAEASAVQVDIGHHAIETLKLRVDLQRAGH